MTDKIPRTSDTILGWARDLRKQMYGKQPKGSVDKSIRRHTAKSKALMGKSK